MGYSGIFNHHAYLLTGDREASKKKLLPLLFSELGVRERANPDFHSIFLESLGIEEARGILSIGERKVFGEKPRVVILSFHSATSEAQNALLKILEEPPENSLFFLLVSAPNGLLPTLRSRLSSLILSEVEKGDAGRVGAEFLSQSVAERLKVIESIAKKDNQEKKSELLNLLNSVELAAVDYFGGEIPAEWQKPLGELLTLKKYLFDRAPSVKMIGEYLALRIPRTEGRR